MKWMAITLRIKLLTVLVAVLGVLSVLFTEIELPVISFRGAFLVGMPILSIFALLFVLFCSPIFVHFAIPTTQASVRNTTMLALGLIGALLTITCVVSLTTGLIFNNLLSTVTYVRNLAGMLGIFFLALRKLTVTWACLAVAGFVLISGLFGRPPGEAVHSWAWPMEPTLTVSGTIVAGSFSVVGVMAFITENMKFSPFKHRLKSTKNRLNFF